MAAAHLDALVEVSPGETRVALVDAAGRLRRLWLERISRISTVGGIYLGRVVKVEKGMGAAFVDIGLADLAFLNKARGLHEDEALVVQVVRDAWHGKSARVTSQPRVEGRYLAIGVHGEADPKIECVRGSVAGARRAHLETTVRELAKPAEEVRVKEAAALVSSTELAAEADRLRLRWQLLRDGAAKSKPPHILEAPPGLAVRLLREIAAIGEIVVDDLGRCREIERLVGTEMPDLEGKVIHHGGDRPLFDDRGVGGQIDEALERRVLLPSGIELTFDQTEALTAVDVDMAGSAAGGNHEQEVTRANLDAIPCIANQIVLRNLAGLIVIDFISMRKKTDRRHVVEALRKALRSGADGAVDVLGMTAGGLVEVTRQRKGPGLADFYTRLRSSVLDPEALACASLRDVLRTRGPGRPVLLAAPDVIAVLEGALSAALVETGRQLGQPLALRRDAGRIGFEIVLE